MKTRTATLLSLTLLASLVIGIFVVEVYSAPKRARVKGRWYPRTWTEGSPVPNPWNIELGFAPKRSVDEIDTSTIRLEGIYKPWKEPYDRKNRVVVPFKGKDVLAAAFLKAGHMTPGSHLVYLTVTGELKDGTPFSTGMSSVIVLFIDNFPPP